MCQVMHLRIVFLIVSNDVVMCFLCENHWGMLRANGILSAMLRKKC